MENYNDVTLKQENAVLKRLSGEAKKEYYLAVFTSHLVASLRRTRKSLGINQSELAKRTGLKQSYISKIENLEKNPTIETIAKYCYALNFSLEVVEAFEKELTMDISEVPSFNFCRLALIDQNKTNMVRAVF